MPSNYSFPLLTTTTTVPVLFFFGVFLLWPLHAEKQVLAFHHQQYHHQHHHQHHHPFTKNHHCHGPGRPSVSLLQKSFSSLSLSSLSISSSGDSTGTSQPDSNENPTTSSSSSSSSKSGSSEEVTTTTTTTTIAKNNKQQQQQRRRRVSLLVCPAQFCVPDDYQVLFDNLLLRQGDYYFGEDSSSSSSSGGGDGGKTNNSIAGIETGIGINGIEIGTTIVAPLPRTEWIKVAKQLPTRNFWDATLPVHKTLGWYFDAIETGLSEIFAKEGPDANICIIGHSIGGWVARAYLGGLSRSSSAVGRVAAQRCTSLITLGTPHVAPDSALVDQTRGLIREIDEAPTCSAQALADRGIDITCVCSSSLKGAFLSTNVEELVAASSYLPLLGRVGSDVLGDGIVPLELAFMDPPARQVIVEKCEATGAMVRHSHVLPTPWNLWDGYAPSIDLPDDFTSYVSEGVIRQWAKYIG